MMNNAFATLKATALSCMLVTSAYGHDKGGVGKPAKAADAQRTVEVIMGDIYFEPKELALESGETVRFVVKNIGQLIHEFNIGTEDMHKAHRKEMSDMMKTGALTATGLDHSKMDHSGMKHDDPNSVLVEPGNTMELTWTFPKSGKLKFACNVPGHSEAGMIGDFTVGHNH